MSSRHHRGSERNSKGPLMEERLAVLEWTGSSEFRGRPLVLGKASEQEEGLELGLCHSHQEAGKGRSVSDLFYTMCLICCHRGLV